MKEVASEIPAGKVTLPSELNDLSTAGELATLLNHRVRNFMQTRQKDLESKMKIPRDWLTWFHHSFGLQAKKALNMKLQHLIWTSNGSENSVSVLVYYRNISFCSSKNIIQKDSLFAELNQYCLYIDFLIVRSESNKYSF